MAIMTDIPALPVRRTPPHILTLVALVGVSTLSMNIFLPSLPAMATWYGTDYATMQLAVPVYLWTSGLLQVMIGPLSDRFGRRPVLLSGLAVFMVATLGCLMAPTVGTFLAFRVVQAGIVTAMVLSRAIVRDLYSQDKAASMLGYVTMGMSVFPMIGPIIGGQLEFYFGWQSNFAVLLVAGALLFLLAWRDLGETAPNLGAPFRDQFRAYPELLRSPRFWGYCLASAFASGAFFAYLGGAPYVGATLFGMDPATLGLYFGAPAVGYFAGNFVSGRFSQQVGVDRMVLGGAILQASGLAALVTLTLSGLTGPNVFFGFMVFLGLGNGMVIPNATAGMLSVRPAIAGAASGLGGATMICGGAALAMLAGPLLVGADTALPLELLMLSSGLASVAAIALTVRRNRRRGL